MTAIANIGFNSKVFISGTIQAMTALHIGGNSIEMGIGGADQIVVRDPITNSPYIPGSSLRGKMRSLFEQARQEMTIKTKKKEGGRETAGPVVHRVGEVSELMEQGWHIGSAGPCMDASFVSAQLFGISVDRQQGARPEDIVPQRLVVRDAMLTNADVLNSAPNTDMPMTEVKTEVNIDRITSEAVPRQIERVPAGALFGFQVIINLFGTDTAEQYLPLVFESMQLLQDDYLGGHGSRGYGRIKFNVDVPLRIKTAEDYRSGGRGSQLDFNDIPADLLPEPASPETATQG